MFCILHVMMVICFILNIWNGRGGYIAMLNQKLFVCIWGFPEPRGLWPLLKIMIFLIDMRQHLLFCHPTPRIGLSVRLSVRNKISAASQIYASYIHVSGSRIEDHMDMYHTYMHHTYRIKYQGSYIHASYLHASYTHGSMIKDQISCIICRYMHHTCIRIKGHRHMHNAYMHHVYTHHVYTHHENMLNGYMHQGYMHHGYMHPGKMHH